MAKETIIGIDLGTSNSCVSVMEGGVPTIITNAEGKRTTPSVVAFTKEGRKIGDPAKRQAVTNPEGTVYSIKRFIGKSFKDVKSDVESVSYKVVESDGLPTVSVEGKNYTPQEISAMVLQKMKKTAEDFLGKEVTKAVITVPAYFSDLERNATMEAAKIAGLEVERIINEPTAAALAYGLDKGADEHKVLVFDCGGGTHDVSVLEISEGVFEVLSTDGDTQLGGDDFDNAIINWMVEEFKRENGVDLTKDKMAYQRLREAAEKAKVELSSSAQTDINLPYITANENGPIHFIKSLSRAEFDRMTADLVKRAVACADSALKSAGLKKDDIDEIILVGGSTRIPAIQEGIEKFIGKTANKSVNPDEVVSMGAAIQGGVLSGDVDDVLLLDVTAMPFGIETMGGVMTNLVDANTTIPVSKSQVFSTASDNQSQVSIVVCTGFRPMAKDNKMLGTFNLDGIPPAPRGVPQIEVVFDIDANGVLNVSAKDKGTGKENKITITGGSQLSDEEIERMKAEAEANAEADEKAIKEVEAINGADSMIFQTEKQITEFGEKLSDEDKLSLEEQLASLKTAKDAKDIELINESMESLQNMWNDVSTRMYQSASDETVNESTDSDVEDADYTDFEEVKDEE